MIYKCVAAPRGIVIESGGSSEKAVSSFAGSINSECKDGWNFFSLESIQISEKAGCIAGLFGAKETTKTFNMMIFCKEGGTNNASVSTVEPTKVSTDSK